MLNTLTVAAVLGAAGPVPVQIPTVPPPRPLAELTAAYRLRNVAAADAATAVLSHLTAAGREVAVTPVGPTNELVVSGSPAAHARVAELLGELDRTPPQVVLSMLVATVPADFLRDCGLTRDGAAATTLTPREAGLFQGALRNCPGREVLSRPQVQVADNQTGYVQVGQDPPAGAVRRIAYVPTPAGQERPVVVEPGPRVTARLTPRLMPDGKVLLRVEPQVSAAVPPRVIAGGRAFAVNIQTVQTTAVVPDGHTVVVAVPTTGDDGRPAAVLVVVTANVVRTEGP